MRRPIGYGPSFVVLATAALVLFAGPAAMRQITYAQTEAQIIQASQRLEQDTILERINQAQRDIATLVEPSVVHISTLHVVADRWRGQTRKASSGSGWIYDADGHIVTNHHVVEDAAEIEVQLYTGEMREAEIVGTDPLTDIAVLKIAPGELHPASRRAGEEGLVRQGDMVFAFGSPFDFRFSMSSGVISGKGRSVGVIRNDRGQAVGYENFIQVDAAINPGNSGGPLTDFRGRVIGMNTAIATGPRSGGGYEEGQFAGIGLAIPIEMIEPVVTQIIENGVVTKGYLGVTVVDRDRIVRDELSMLDFRSNGLLIARMDEQALALGHGIRPGDIVTHLGADRIATVPQFRSKVSFLDENEPVTLQVWRFEDDADTGRSIQFQMPGRDARALAGAGLLQPDDTISDLMDELGFVGRAVRVARLMPAGPAREAGLQRGDLITHVNRQPVGTVRQLQSVISSIVPGQTANLTLWRFDTIANRTVQTDVEVKLAELNTLRSAGRVTPRFAAGLEDIGIARMGTASRELADRFETEYHPGVLILEVVPGSSLDRDGVVPGSTIVEVAEAPVDSVEDFVRALAGFDVRRGVRLTIVQPDGAVVKPRVSVE